MLSKYFYFFTAECKGHLAINTVDCLLQIWVKSLKIRASKILKLFICNPKNFSIHWKLKEEASTCADLYMKVINKQRKNATIYKYNKNSWSAVPLRNKHR